MAVFVCAADESADGGNFFYGGWSASLDEWDQFFVPAWNERVLLGPPQIPYIHMTEIRDWDWQTKYGLTPLEAEDRLDAAADVIRSTGRLVPVTLWVNQKDYRSILRQPFTPTEFPGRKVMLEPDYLCFLYFALTQLDWLYRGYGDEVEKVDFWVEGNGRITKYMAGFHRSLISALEYINRKELIPLVGEFNAVGKDRIPAQAADMLGWHARNNERGKLDRAGARRLWKMVVGGSLSHGRYGFKREVSQTILTQLADRFSKYPDALEHAPWRVDEGEQPPSEQPKRGADH